MSHCELKWEMSVNTPLFKMVTKQKQTCSARTVIVSRSCEKQGDEAVTEATQARLRQPQKAALHMIH
ncbi:MAG: hypothetical protein D4R82_04535 [Dehalococcoidia bacterium]|nr:MAG: hypothetical protein D4R82_04535 [Dehalococcoidia bacterium]